MRRTLLGLALLTGLAAAAPAPAQAPPAAKAGEKPVAVPFELLPSRHMVVKVKVNGKGPYRLIFDTGAPITLINNKLARQAGVVAKKGSGGFMGLGMPQMEIKRLEVGPAVLEDTPTVVIDHPTVAAISEAFGPIDGIVGFPFFSRYRTTVDYQKKELTLAPNGYQPGDFLEGMMRRMMDASQQSGEPKVVGSAGLWGMVVDRATGDDEGGVDVKEVLAGGPAAAAGLKAGDRLLTLDGRWTDTVADTHLAASLVKPGRPAALVVKRGGEKVKLTVTPGRGV